MKKTPFKKKSYTWKKKPYTWKVRNDRTDKGLFDHLKKETKQEEWERIKKDILDPYFYKLGLFTVCELRIPNICIGSALSLQYAHSKKRDYIAVDEPERTRELCEVVRACTACHNEIEHLEDTEQETGHEQMYRIVIDCIKRRKAF